jgi:hypothetical protein
MIKRCEKLKNHCNERANYYSKLDFTILAEEFSSVANFLAEIEEVIKNYEEMRESVQVAETVTEEAITEDRAEDTNEI